MKTPDLLQMTVSPGSLRAERSRRRSDSVKKTVPPNHVAAHLEDGWTVERENKRSTRLVRSKPADISFEDGIWTLLADLGFSVLNQGRDFVVRYGKGDANTKQIDVFAADGETVLLVECKATSGDLKKANFKSDIEALAGIKDGLFGAVRSALPDHKAKLIFATSGYVVGQADLDRLDSAGIAYFDDDAIEYCTELTKHLGVVARYQLLGRLFAGTKIQGMENRVPAIEGRMGGNRYYMFSIEPERLLKIGYVLHRSEAHTNLMPAYQRLIKKSRLRSVSEFVRAGNFFPNSIIVSIDAGKRGLQFDRASLGVDGTESRIGILHLPQTYRCAFIIDGQHRLYGYGGSDLARTETVPVVAFLNMERADQVRMFMDINENQKAVPKNLQNTLNASIDWDSSDLRRRDKALKLQLAQNLGERRQSPLNGRVILGENPATKLRCITIEAIKVGFDRGNFFGRVTAKAEQRPGTFSRGSNDQTMSVILPFLEESFRLLREELPDQWSRGGGDGGFVFINPGVQSLLRLLSDIVDHLVAEEQLNPRTIPTEELMEFVAYYLEPATAWLRGLSSEDGAELKSRYGSGGPVRYWRSLQLAIHEAYPEFNPPELADWVRQQAQTHNDASREIVRRVEELLNTEFKELLEAEYGENWLRRGLPRKVYTEVVNRAAQKSFDRDEEVEPWDALLLIDYREIACKDDSQWRRVFEERFTMPGTEALAGRDARTKWIVRLNTIRNDLAHVTGYSVSDEDFEFLQGLADWLLAD